MSSKLEDIAEETCWQSEKGYQQRFIDGALHLLKVAEERCSEYVHEDVSATLGHTQSANNLLNYLRDYCGVGEEENEQKS